MFSIRLTLGAYPCLSGCAALDFERLWQLPETGVTSRTYLADKFQRDWPVSENFARAYFDSDSSFERETIPLNLLKPGEVVRAMPETKSFHPEIRDLVLGDLSPERAQELFVAARVTRLTEAAKEDRQRLECVSEFLANVPADAIRGTAKKMSANQNAAEELIEKVKKASTHTIEADEADEPNEADEE